MATSNDRDKPDPHEWDGAADEPSSSESKWVEGKKRLSGLLEKTAKQMTKTVSGTIYQHELQRGALHEVGEAIASKLEEDFKRSGEDLNTLIRRNPLPSFLLGIGVGILLGRLTKRS